MISLARSAATAFLLGLGACAFAPGTPISLEDLVDDAATYDVVFLGEEHDNDLGHLQHLQILKLLHAELVEAGDREIVLSMEMFERDVQGVLDSYLAGEIEEEEFIEGSRPWPKYRRHYRPLVRYAKKHGMRVIAANVPRPLAKKVSSEGIEAVEGDPNIARETTAPKDAYWEEFKAAMDGHGGVDDDSMYSFYQSQCLKDDTMAEAIVDVIQAAEQRPLVVHVNGKFHSDLGLGTAARVSWRMPELHIVVLSMDTEPSSFRTGDSRYLLRVPVQPEIAEVELEGEGDEGEAGEGDEATEDDDDALIEGEGRPALGFMPGYEDEVLGVLVDMLVEGGPAEKAGIERGDVIIRVGDRDVESVSDYWTVLADLTTGEKVEVTVQRGDEQKALEVTVGRRSQ